MLNDFISIIESLGVSLSEFTYICIIFYLFSKPVNWLIRKFYKGVGQ